MIIKAAPDAAEVSKEDVEELKAISGWASASPLLIAERIGEEELDEDAIYVRNGVYAVSIEAFERSLEGDPPLVEVGSTGCFVYIDGEAIRKRREELGLSVGELARLVGVSRMTIYSYERGKRRTSPSVAYMLEYVLGVPLVIPINPLDASGRERREEVERGSLYRYLPTGILRTVARLLSRLKLKVRAFSRAPFDIMVRCDGEMLKVALNVIYAGDYDENRIEATKAFAELTGFNHLVVGPAEYEGPGNVVSIRIDELRSMRKPRDFVKLFL